MELMISQRSINKAHAPLFGFVSVVGGKQTFGSFRTHNHVIWSHKCTNNFQYMTNDFFQDFMDIFLMIYLNDILVYSKTQDKHDVHVRKVLYTFVGFYAKLERCCLDDNQREF